MKQPEYELMDRILRIKLENGQHIDVELFIRPGYEGPQISASSAMNIWPESSNRIIVSCPGR